MTAITTIRGSDAALPCVPVLDVRNGGPVEHARLRPAQAVAVRDHCLGWLPLGRVLAWLGDPLVRAWLRRSGSPYVGDIGAIAGTVGGTGTWLLHGAYLFGCTALVDEGEDGPRLRRTLDWPFPGLGQLVEVAHQAGTAGDYLSVTWPGFAGVLTAVAPGRFAAAINQAPMRRTAEAAWLRWIDYGLNAIRALTCSGRELPEHLLRRAFETCDSFEAARELLRTAPVARPVLFTLTGTRAGEVAVIERTETGAQVFDGAATVANAWRQAIPGWEARVCGVGTPVENNRRRRAALAPWTGRAGRCFGWAQAPVVNSFTRLTVEMEAARGALRVAGWEADGRGSATPVTRNLSLADRVATTCADDAPEIAA